MKAPIEITKRACVELSKMAKTHNTRNILFRVKGGGCNGFNYKIEPFKTEIEKGDEIIKRDYYQLVVCKVSLFHLLGTKIDWEDDYMGSRFVFTNPQAKSKCGCGTSFSI